LYVDLQQHPNAHLTAKMRDTNQQMDIILNLQDGCISYPSLGPYIILLLYSFSCTSAFLCSGWNLHASHDLFVVIYLATWLTPRERCRHVSTAILLQNLRLNIREDVGMRCGACQIVIFLGTRDNAMSGRQTAVSGNQ